MSQVLIAGIGNIFNLDDGFGVAVARKLNESPLPEGARVTDFGIRGFDLVLALLEEWDLVILVDAVSRGGDPGTLYLIEPEWRQLPDSDQPGAFENAHTLDPMRVLATAKGLGAKPGRVVLVGCEPQTLGDDTGHIGLSPAVEAAVPQAGKMILSMVRDLALHPMDEETHSRKDSVT